MKYVAPSAPQPIGAVLDDAIRLFRASWSRCWFLAVIPGLVGLVIGLAEPQPAPTRGNPSLESLLHSLAVTFTPTVIALYCLYFFFGVIFQGAVLAQVAAIAGGNATPSAAQAMGTGVRRMLWMILGEILFTIVITIGLVALIIPGVWLWGRLMLWTPALFVDGQNSIEAFGTSWRLTRGNWWRGAVIATVAIIIAVVLAVVFGLVGPIVAGILSPLSPLDATGQRLLAQSFSVAGNALYVPLIAAMWIAMYRDFKLRREGGDLESRAAALGRAA